MPTKCLKIDDPTFESIYLDFHLHRGKPLNVALDADPEAPVSIVALERGEGPGQYVITLEGDTFEPVEPGDEPQRVRFPDAKRPRARAFDPDSPN